MRKIISIILAAVLILSVVAINVAAKTSSYEESSFAEDIENNKDDLVSTSDKIIPADMKVEKDIKEVPVKTLVAVTKNDYYTKILNSIDYYNVVSGTIETNMLNDVDTKIEYGVDMTKCNAYQHVVCDDVNEEVFVQDNKIYTIDNINKTRNYAPEFAYAKSDELLKDNEESDNIYESLVEKTSEERITYNTVNDVNAKSLENFSDNSENSADETIIPVYHYRPNPTNIHYASTVSLFPQEIAFGFLSNESLWEISEKTEFLGRKCTILKGVTGKDYGTKLNISRFVMIVDDKSGIVLSFEAYDSDDNLTQYSTTTSLSFDKEEIKTFKLSDYQNYSAE